MVSTNGAVSEYTIMYRNDGSQTGVSGIAYVRLDGFLMDGYTKNDVKIYVKRNGKYL
jgi:hypothetical protein